MNIPSYNEECGEKQKQKQKLTKRKGDVENCHGGAYPPLWGSSPFKTS